MNVGLILSGGKGERLGSARPKQYLEINGKPIIGYALDTFQKADAIDAVVVVCDAAWEPYLREYVKAHKIDKHKGFAPSGASRQASIKNGLRFCRAFCGENDIVVVHDAARPLVSERLLLSLVDTDGCDGVMPALPVKDTLYLTEDGKTVGNVLNRDAIVAGQAPESFRFGPYYAINESASDAEIAATRGSAEIAFRHGLSVRLVAGEESNYKITTQEDLKRFRSDIEKNSGIE